MPSNSLPIQWITFSPQICSALGPSQSLQCHIVYHRCAHFSGAIQLQKMLSYCLKDVVWFPLINCAWNVIIGDITGGFLPSSKGKSSCLIVEVGHDHDETNWMSNFPPVCMIGSKAVSPREHLGAVPFNDRFVPCKTCWGMIGTSFIAEGLRQAEREAGGLLCNVGGPKRGVIGWTVERW